MAVNINVRYTINGCGDCPNLKTGQSYGNDGTDGKFNYLCIKGAFGVYLDSPYMGYTSGPNTIPLVPPYGCPYFNTDPVTRLASKLNVTKPNLERILKEEHCKIIEDNQEV